MAEGRSPEAAEARCKRIRYAVKPFDGGPWRSPTAPLGARRDVAVARSGANRGTRVVAERKAKGGLGRPVSHPEHSDTPTCDLGYDPAVARRDRRPKGTGAAEDEVQTERDGDRDRAQWRCRWIGCQRQWGQCGKQVQSRKRPGSSKRSNTQQLTIPETLRVPPNALVSVGSRFKGYRDFVVQDLRIEPHNIRSRLEVWLTHRRRAAARRATG